MLMALAGVVVGPIMLAGAAELVTVSQKGRAFATRELRIARGDTVRFANDDDFPHQIQARGPGLELDSDLQAPGESLAVPFPAAGAFEVRCGVHPKMRLTITVQ